MSTVWWAALLLRSLLEYKPANEENKNPYSTMPPRQAQRRSFSQRYYNQTPSDAKIMPHELWPSTKPRSIFEGDGRVYLNPVNAPAGTKPIRVSRKNAQRYIKWFHERGGVSESHSALGQTVWVLVTHCIEQGHNYTVQPHYIDGKTAGWSIRKL